MAVQLRLQVLLRIGQHLREQSVHRNGVAPFLLPLLHQHLGDSEGHLLHAHPGAPLLQVHHRSGARPVGRERAIRGGQALHQRDVGHRHRVQHQRRHLLPGDGQARDARVGVALHHREGDLVLRLGRHRINLVGWRRGRLLGAAFHLERNQLEGHAEYLGRFFAEEACGLVHRIRGAAQRAAYYLFAQQLRTERPKAHHMRNGGGVPAFGQHGHADDAAHVTPRRHAGVQRQQRAGFVFQCLVVVPVHQRRVFLGHLVARPGGLADGFQQEAQAPGFVVLAAAFGDVFGHLAVHAHRPFPARCVSELFGRRAVGAAAVGQPVVQLFGQGRVAAHDDEDRRHINLAVASIELSRPLGGGLPPFVGKLGDGLGRVAHQHIRGQLPGDASFL